MSTLKEDIDAAWERLKHVPVRDAEAYNTAYQQWLKLRNTCPSCRTTDHLEFRDKDRLWGDAELWCSQCDCYIRLVTF